MEFAQIVTAMKQKKGKWDIKVLNNTKIMNPKIFHKLCKILFPLNNKVQWFRVNTPRPWAHFYRIEIALFKKRISIDRAWKQNKEIVLFSFYNGRKTFYSNSKFNF
jgi:hypothetical protein